MSKLGYFDSIISDAGRPIVATITVFDAGTATPSTIYTTAAGTVLKANPFVTDALGRFQFFAAGGTYDVQVSGAGITTYKIENISLVLTGPAGPVDGICPEDYGAVGDGVTDDWAAFNAMFAALAAGGAYAGTVRRKVILNPVNYYSIQSALNATDVFNIAIDSLIMEGPGMDKKTFGYDGAATVTNFFHFTNVTSEFAVHLQDMEIDGHLTKIGNIVFWGEPYAVTMIKGTATRVSLKYASVAGFDGPAWMIKYDHCEVLSCALGFGPAITSGTYINCYANACAIGYYLQGYYSLLDNCCCDHATVCAYKMYTTGAENGGQHTLVECAAEDANQVVNAFCVGGPIMIIGGSFTGSGTTDPLFFFHDSCFHLIGVSPSVNTTNTWWVKFEDGSYSTYGGFQWPTVTREIPASKIYGYLTADTAAPIRISEEAQKNAWVSAGTLAVLDTKCAELSSSVYRKGLEVLFSDAAPTFASTVELKWIRGAGHLLFHRGDLSSAITLAAASGGGFSFDSIETPVIFEKYYFKFTGATPMFKVRNCKLIRFIGCKFETTTANTVVFDLGNNDYSNIEIDKTTMDNMAVSGAGSWSRLYTDPWPQHRKPITFNGYSAKPTAGYFDRDCVVVFNTQTAGAYLGAVCVLGGDPGTWKYFGAIEA
jgi:hypothetical protein